MDWKTFGVAFLCGSFGGAAPRLLDLSGRFMAEQPPNKGFYLSMLIVACIGGAIAVVYKERVTHKAFLLGVSAPALIAAAETAAVPPSALMLPALHAAAPAQVGALTRVLTVAPDSATFDPGSVTGDVVVRIGDTWRRVHLDRERDGPAVAIIPRSATAIYFDGTVAWRGKSNSPPADIRTEQVTLTPGIDPLVFRFTKGQQTFVGGVFDGIGWKRSAQRYVRYSAKVESRK
jgi:hypothetical protein